jgi:predicted GIY-YIG superfamily endonuclease
MSGAQVYRCFDAQGNLLYIGASYNAVKRLSEHRGWSAYWFHKCKRVDVQHFDNRQDALLAEAMAIRTENPLYNTVGRIKKRIPTSKEIKATNQAWVQSFCPSWPTSSPPKAAPSGRPWRPRWMHTAAGVYPKRKTPAAVSGCAGADFPSLLSASTGPI